MKALLLDTPERLRQHLRTQGEVFEPRRDQAGNASYQAASDEPLPLQSALPLPQFSPKQFLFAERETLFTFDGKRFTPAVPHVVPRALFGVRACDLTAIAYQDHFFREDPQYLERRKHTLLVGIDCLQPCQRGFCPTVDAGPFVREGTADLVLHPTGDAEAPWLLLVLTATGEEAMRGLDLAPAAQRDIAARASLQPDVVALFPDASHIVEGVRRLNAGEVTSTQWDTLGVQCLACSGCTHLCPTCSCFATYDRPTPQGFERNRCWDSCLYEGFQKEASGHHPQPTAGQRVFRYWYHKFSDDFVPEFGRYGCVGCGRCEQTCPGSIGVHSIMKRIAEGP